MFSYSKFYKLYNNHAAKDYLAAKDELAYQIAQLKGRNEKGFRDRLRRFLLTEGQRLVLFTEMEAKWTDNYLESAYVPELDDDLNTLFGPLSAAQYEKSNLNPAYLEQGFGKDPGRALSVIAAYWESGVYDVYDHKLFRLCEKIGFFNKVAKSVQHGRISNDSLRELYYEHRFSLAEEDAGLYLHERFNPQLQGKNEIITAGISYQAKLYQLGEPVTMEELRFADFIQGLSEDEADKLAASMVKAYLEAFERDNKRAKNKKTVRIDYQMGMERVIEKALDKFADAGKTAFVGEVYHAPLNENAEYDHRMDEYFFMDDAYAEKYLATLKKHCEENAGMLTAFGGPCYVFGFGRTSFVPANAAEEAVSAEARAALEKLETQRDRIINEAGDGANAAYSMIAYPTPAICGEEYDAERYTNIFRELIEINTADQERVKRAQNALINALDRGTSVFIKGRGENETSLTVALAKLDNPKKQSLFYNCLADFNVPDGEVFTTPKLAGTDGLLHVRNFYWDGLEFKNLKLSFKDGYVVDYSCDGFETGEQGKAFIRENLLLPQETLPMGEFAIGTNTRAYAWANKYQLFEKLPVLIFEKLGPHFALGDSCFAGAEDIAVYNYDRKEVIARANEKTALRKSSPNEAYTGKHIDITLPISDIERLTVQSSYANNDLIRGGKYVLIGTDSLNIPLLSLNTEA